MDLNTIIADAVDNFNKKTTKKYFIFIFLTK